MVRTDGGTGPRPQPGPASDAVREICGRVEASGAPRYTAALEQPLNGTGDGLLPDN